MDFVYFGVIPFCIFITIVMALCITSWNTSVQESNDTYIHQPQFKMGYTAGWNACQKYLHEKYSKAFEEFEYDNTQLAYENENLKKSYELWLKNRVGQLLKNEDACHHD